MTRIQIVLGAAAIFLAAAFACAAEPRTVYDLASPAEWKPADWNAAAGRFAASDEFPPDLPAEGDVPRRSLAVTIPWPAQAFVYYNLEPRQPLPIPFAVREVGLWVKGTGGGQSVEVHFNDAQAKDVKVGWTLKDTKWQRLSAKIPESFAQPLTVRSITFHNYGDRAAGRSVIHIARLQVSVDPAARLREDPAPALFVLPDDAWGIAGEDGRAGVTLKAFAWSGPARKLELRQQVADWNGKELWQKSDPVELSATWSKRQSIELPALGAYQYTVELREPGREAPIAASRRSLARLAAVPRLSAELRDRSPVGVNTHLGAPWELFARLGIHWARDYSFNFLGRGQTAPIGNGLDFAGISAHAEEAGVIVLPVLQGAFRDSAGAAFINDSAAIRQGFERLSRALPGLKQWELDNEADLSFPRHRLEEANYVNLIRSAAAGLRAAGKASVVLNGTAGIHYDDTVSLMKTRAREDFAVVNYHYYSGVVPPEIAREDINASAGQPVLGFLDQLRRINDLAHGAGKQAWLTEIGWDVRNEPAVGERLQAVYLPRAYLLSLLCGTDRIFWYFDRDVRGSKERFGTCGLIDAEGNLRPSAAAMAALSSFIAQAQVGGSVDVGEDRWCVLLRQPSGAWVAAAWSVRETHPLPRDLAEATAFDLFGNPIKPTQLTPEVAYFQLAQLPPEWEAQRRVQWIGPVDLMAAPGATIKVTIRSPEMATVAGWASLPARVAATPFSREGENLVSTLTCGAGLAPGRLAMKAFVRGTTWRREWEPWLRIVQPVRIEAGPYADRLVVMHLSPALDQRLQATLETPADQGAILPSTLWLEPGDRQPLAFMPGPKARGPIPLTCKLSTGSEQTFWLRPRVIEAMRNERIEVDGALDEWPARERMDARFFATGSAGLPVEAWFAWSAKGLHLAARIAATDLASSNPREFWNGTGLELFIDTDPRAGGWGKTGHQFWLTPVKENGGWRLYAGEWKRGEAIPATVYDDRRIRTAITVGAQAFSLEAFIPAEALGAAPAADGRFAAVLNVRVKSAGETAEGAWPNPKAMCLPGDLAAWGILRFRE